MYRAIDSKLYKLFQNGYPRMIALEGPDGAGKTSVAQILCKYLQDELDQFHKVYYLANPLKSGLGGEIRNLLLNSDQYDCSIQTETMLSLINYFIIQDFVYHKLGPKDFVVVDRWLLTNYIYQIKCGDLETIDPMFAAWVKQVPLIQPFCTIFLTADQDILTKRKQEQDSKFENYQFQAKVQHYYHKHIDDLIGYKKTPFVDQEELEDMNRIITFHQRNISYPYGQSDDTSIDYIATCLKNRFYDLVDTVHTEKFGNKIV